MKTRPDDDFVGVAEENPRPAQDVGKQIVVAPYSGEYGIPKCVLVSGLVLALLYIIKK